MVQEAQLEALIDQLNQSLGDITPYKIDIVDPRDLIPVGKNAHYMAKTTFDQLSANIAQDKNLSTLPFCWRREDGRYVVLSGNHRMQAARDAGVSRILILYTDKALTEDEQIAIQLSHNSLVGQDNPVILRELWDRITVLDLKEYAGLDEDSLVTVQPANIVQLSEAPLRFERLVLLFVSSEMSRLEEIAKEIGASPKGTRWVSDVSDFDRFFEALLTFKETAGILNTSTAFKALTEIAIQWIEENQPPEDSQANE